MPLVIPDGFANVITTIVNGGGGISKTSTVGMGLEVGAPMAQGNVDAIANLMRDGLKPIWDNGWHVGPVKIYERQGGILKVWQNDTTEAGTATAGDYASPAVAIVVSKQTGLVGKWQRGRLYLPGVLETKVDEGGVLDGGYVGDVQTAVSAWGLSLQTVLGSEALVLLHDSESPHSHTPTPIVYLRVRNIAATMRPRQRRRTA